jgi:hypothetical protein
MTVALYNLAPHCIVVYLPFISTAKGYLYTCVPFRVILTMGRGQRKCRRTRGDDPIRHSLFSRPREGLQPNITAKVLCSAVAGLAASLKKYRQKESRQK